MPSVAKITYRQKTHEPGTTRQATYAGPTERYLGDVWPAEDGGWRAHPAGSDSPLRPTFESRAKAAAALRELHEV
jgi:hypothetical protein